MEMLLLLSSLSHDLILTSRHGVFIFKDDWNVSEATSKNDFVVLNNNNSIAGHYKYTESDSLGVENQLQFVDLQNHPSLK